MERDEQLVMVMKDILKVLAKEYPEKFTEDGMTPMGIQVMGIMQQLLGGPPQGYTPSQ
tara:strand:- start:96 stop:269 length:174 start_codon:yes stop_codon:yes gene_type:complete